VISQLDEKYVAEVVDIINSPYTTLKTELVKRFNWSTGREIRQLFTLEEMGDPPA
jgi:hypothetical protein